jgi:hypothetical protein
VVEVRDLARVHTREAIATLVEIMRDDSKSEHARIAAATQLLNRGWGLPPGAEWLANLNVTVNTEPTLMQQHVHLSPATLAIFEEAERTIRIEQQGEGESDGEEVTEVLSARVEAAPALIDATAVPPVPRLVTDASRAARHFRLGVGAPRQAPDAK